MITLNHYLLICSLLFVIGMAGVIRRKNLLMLFFATELMLNAVNIALVAISKYHNDFGGQMFALFIIAIAASEVAVGLGLLIVWYKRRGTLDIDSLKSLNG